MAEQTQTASVPASASASSEGAASQGSSDSTQPTNGVKVENARVEDKGNSAASDEQDGADSGDGGRQRPGRAERRISELNKVKQQLEAELKEKNDLLTRLQNTSVNDVKLPDYSQMTEITPEQLKQDIINAASQIVDLKMQTTATALEERLSAKEASQESAKAMESTIKKYSVLNPNSEDYDANLDSELTEAYSAALQKDPSYSFSTFIKPFARMLDTMSNTTSGSESSSRGTSANRQAASKRSANEFDPNWSAEKMEAWFASKR